MLFTAALSACNTAHEFNHLTPGPIVAVSAWYSVMRLRELRLSPCFRLEVFDHDNLMPSECIGYERRHDRKAIPA